MSRFGPPMHALRQTKRELTDSERIGIAQRTSLRYRDTEVTLPLPPWIEEEEE